MALLAAFTKNVFNELVATRTSERGLKPAWMPAKPVEDFSLPATGGVTFRLSEHRGKKALLIAYASW